MTNLPFQCGNCGNYYIAIPTEETCGLCALGTHAPHHKTGIVDCHFSQQSATPSEVAMLKLTTSVQDAVIVAQRFVEKARDLKTRDAVSAGLLAAEQAFAKAERDYGGMNETVRWAGVFEMPGKRDAAPEERFKSIGVIEQYVRENRRPPEDLAILRRSVKVCAEMADTVTGLMAEARMAIGQARQADTNWAPKIPETSTMEYAKRLEVKRNSIAKAREVKAKKRELAGTAA